MIKVFFLAAIVPLLASGCGSRATAPSPSATGVAPLLAPSRTLPPEYRTLAKHLGNDLKSSISDFRDSKSLKDVLAEGHAAVLDLKGIGSSDREIQYLAAQGAKAYSDALSRLERIDALPKPRGAVGLMAESFVHGLYGNVYAGFVLGTEAEAKQRAILDEFAAFASAVERADAAHLLLPRVAERYAAPASPNNGRVAIDFDEAWNAWGPHDWCRLYNSGDDLEDCTVVVDLKGAGGQSRRNVHFVPRWPGKTWLVARYDPGKQVGERQFGRMTVRGVETVDVRFLSPAFSTEVAYVYAGAEKTKDIKYRLDLARPLVVPRVRDSAWGSGSGKVLVLDSRMTHPLYQVRVLVESAGGASVGEFVRPTLAAGGSMDVGSWQVSRNLVVGDKVTVWVGEGLLLTTAVR